MIAKIIKAYFEERKERKRISEQYTLEKKCVEYFDKSVLRWMGNLEELIGSTPLPEKGIYLLVKFKKDSFPLQAVRLHRFWGDERPVLSYGDYSCYSTYEWLTSVEIFLMNCGFLLKIIHVQHVQHCFCASIVQDITRSLSIQIKYG